MPHSPQLLPCDGCGQPAEPQHIAQRLQRLEWATRYRPIHIQALLVSGIVPGRDDEYLYNPEGRFTGEAGSILSAVGIATDGKTADAALTEFQKLGLMLIHVLECPLAGDFPAAGTRTALERHLLPTLTRIRRSLKPKRVILISPQLDSIAESLRNADLSCPVYPAQGVFLSGSTLADAALPAFQAALGATHAQTA